MLKAFGCQTDFHKFPRSDCPVSLPTDSVFVRCLTNDPGDGIPNCFYDKIIKEIDIMKPIVAVVGRPNVGKSTFFNRVTRSRDALVDNLPGVTRDRHYKDARWNGVSFTLVDTGGFITDEADAFSAHIRHQVRQAIADADAVVMMLDGKTGVSPYDREMIEMLRVAGKPVFFVVNKIDGESHEVKVFDFYAFGIEPIFGISAEHGYGVPDLLDALIAAFPRSEAETPAVESIRVAVVGRPNVGKSSLINRILGEDRLVVSDVAGTTRDCVDTVYELDRRSYLLVDTAGIRRKAKVSEKLEKYSIIKALKSLDRCDVALIVLDAENGITEQDVTIAGYAHERGCGCILLLNKWDIIGERDRQAARKYYEQLRERTKFLNYAPVMTVSALTGFRVRKIFEMINEVYAQFSRRIGTGQVNRILEKAVAENEPSMHQGRRIKFYYCSQISVKPPTFVFFVNYPEAVHFSYQRYLTNRLREGLGLDKTPIRMILRKRVGSSTK